MSENLGEHEVPHCTAHTLPTAEILSDKNVFFLNYKTIETHAPKCLSHNNSSGAMVKYCAT